MGIRKRLKLKNDFKTEYNNTNRMYAIGVIVKMLGDYTYNTTSDEYKALVIALKSLCGWECVEEYLKDRAKHYEGKPSWDDFFSGGLEAIDDLSDFIKEYWREDE